MTQLVKRPSRLTVVLLLLVALMMLVACGGGDEPTPTPMPTPTPLPIVEEAAAQGGPVEGPTATPAAGESPLGAPDSPMPTPTATPTPLGPPDVDIEEGKSAVVGKVVNKGTGEPIAKAIVRLPEVYCPEDVKPEEKETRCFYALDDAFSPFATSDEEGNFEFLNVEPRDYVLFVGDIAGMYNLSVQDEEKPIIYTAPADVGIDLGTVPVAYP